MANPEHVEILKQGVDVWNRWREENPEILKPDLSNANFLDAILVKLPANFRGKFQKQPLVDANWPRPISVRQILMEPISVLQI